MIGKTLLVSREVQNHVYYRKRLEVLGFGNVTVTALEKDALCSLIRELKPDRILMSARFYHCCTPFKMGEMRREFPGIKLAAIALGEYPADVAMYFIFNGINSYICSFDGIDQFYKGLDEVARGRDYVSPNVVERLDLRREKPEPAGKISGRQLEVVRLVCCGFRDNEIADVLAVSRNTVVNHKTDLFTVLNARNTLELLRNVLKLEILRLEELFFYPRGIILNPQPDKKLMKPKNTDRGKYAY